MNNKLLCTKFLLINIVCVLFFYPNAFPNNVNNRIKFDHITVDQGLSQNSVMAIIQDSRGFMWFGTQEGLNRYDGYHFKIFEHDPDDNTFLHYKIDPANPYSSCHNFIWSIEQDTSAAFSICTQKGGLYLVDSKMNNIKHVMNEPSDTNSLSNNYIYSVLQDISGILWIGTNGGGLNKLGASGAKSRGRLH